MKWQRITIVSRLVCLFFGVVGLLLALFLLSDLDKLKDQSTESLFNLAMAGVGFLIFLFFGIVGKTPTVSNPTQEQDRE